MAETYRLHGYKEFIRACDRAGRESKKEVRGTFRKVGDIVRTDARHKLSALSPRPSKGTPQGLRTIVRQRGVDVEQTKRKTTATRPDWGATQMREALVPALVDKEDEVVEAMEDAIDTVADHFSRG